MESGGQAPGFYGKLPSHGDFVGRRLPPAVRDCLDGWLQRALVHSRAALGPAWLATWGSSPLWRFVIGAGVCNEQAWAGVMMPSADRVGRCFPLLLAAPVEGTPSLRACLTIDGPWFSRLEELALSALDDCFSADDLNTALLVVSRQPRGVIGSRLQANFAGNGAGQLAQGTVEPLPPDGFCGFGNDPLENQSAWWTTGSRYVPPSLALYPGLPAPEAFLALLDGHWAKRGWNLLCNF